MSERAPSRSGDRAAPRRFLIVATNEGGGDIQPLLAITAGLLARGHRVTAFGDAAVPPKMAPLGISTVVAPPELALGAAIAARAREVGHLPLGVHAEWLRDRQVTWAERLGVAAVVPRADLAAESLEAAARRVLTDRSVAERLAAVSRRLQAHDSVRAACSLIATV